MTDGYRDETENLRHRVAELEKELGEAHDTIGRLTGVTDEDPPGTVETRSRLLDAPATVRFVRELDHEITEEGFEAIGNLLRSQRTVVVPVVVQQVGRTLTGPGFSLESKDGVTRIELTADLRGLSLAAISGSVLGGGFAGLATFAVVHDAFLRTLAEAHALWMIPLGIGAAFLGFRKMSADIAKRRARQHRGTFEAVCEVASRHRVAAPAKVRVDIEEEPAEHEREAEPALAEARSPATPAAEP